MRLRAPKAEDGIAIWRLVRDSGELDLNSPYAYLLFATYFPDTCIVAESGDEPAGFVLGFRQPARQDTLFIWQIAVAAPFRGQGVAVDMLATLLQRQARGFKHDSLRFVEATITPSNSASKRMFRALAVRMQTAFEEGNAPLFSKDVFPGGEHEDEVAIRIGPIRAFPAKGDKTNLAAAAK